MDYFHLKRLLEAVLFAAPEPLTLAVLRERLAEHWPDDVDLATVLTSLQADYNERGIQLRPIGDRWAFRTAPDLGFVLRAQVIETRRLSRSALEVLSIIAYRQPVSRHEIEAIRGVSLGKGTLDVLLDTGWVGLGKRRDVPGKPLTYITTPQFLEQFGLASLRDLPGLKEMKDAGLLDAIADAGPLFKLSDSVEG